MCRFFAQMQPSDIIRRKAPFSEDRDVSVGLEVIKKELITNGGFWSDYDGTCCAEYTCGG